MRAVAPRPKTKSWTNPQDWQRGSPPLQTRRLPRCTRAVLARTPTTHCSQEPPPTGNSISSIRTANTACLSRRPLRPSHTSSRRLRRQGEDQCQGTGPQAVSAARTHRPGTAETFTQKATLSNSGHTMRCQAGGPTRTRRPDPTSTRRSSRSSARRRRRPSHSPTLRAASRPSPTYRRPRKTLRVPPTRPAAEQCSRSNLTP